MKVIKKIVSIYKQEVYFFNIILFYRETYQGNKTVSISSNISIITLEMSESDNNNNNI